MVRKIGLGVLVLLALALWPAAAHAQSAITGIIRDTSGAVMPGVTVEAASPALIEKVRSVTTDGDGRYQIVDLRPGVYTITATLEGFSTIRREGVELPLKNPDAFRRLGIGFRRAPLPPDVSENQVMREIERLCLPSSFSFSFRLRSSPMALSL